MKKWMAFLCAVLMVLLCTACVNPDPNVPPTTAGSRPAFTNPTTTGGPAPSLPAGIQVDALANRSYELRYLLGQKSFASADEIPALALVQFAFCHMYYENLCDMPSSGMTLREATLDQLRQQVEAYFGQVATDLTKADLYNKAKGIFEMWEPTYGTEIFYDARLTQNSEGLYVCTTTFYKDAAKTQLLGQTVLTVEDVDGRAVIRQLQSQ